MSEELEFKAQYTDYMCELQLLILHRQGERIATVSSMNLEDRTGEWNEGQYIEPSLRLTRSSAQRLMDALHTAGLRPSEEVDNEGELKATRRHLEDMRKCFELVIKDR